MNMLGQWNTITDSRYKQVDDVIVEEACKDSIYIMRKGKKFLHILKE